MPHQEVNGHTTYYEEAGDGPVVLLLHGAAASSISFEVNIDDLRRDFRVIAPDLRGMGRSEHVVEIEPTGWTDDLIELLDQLGVGSFHVAGTSLGARVALRMALAAPDRVITVTADSPILADSREGSAALEERFGSAMPSEMAQNFEHWNGPEWRELVSNYLVLRRSPGLQEFYDLSEQLANVTCPVLVSRGDIDDVIHPIAHSVEAHSRLLRSSLWIAPNTRFSTMRYRPGEAGEKFRAFVQGAAT